MNGESPLNFINEEANKRKINIRTTNKDSNIKEYELKNPNSRQQVKIRVIDYPDTLGFEEAIEQKKRYYTIKCISPTAQLVKINLTVRTLFYFRTLSI